MAVKDKSEDGISRRDVLKGGLYLGLAMALPSGIFIGGCGGGRRKKDINVILIIIDTLRADYVGCYGNTSGLTPELDAYAESAYLFEKTFAHSPWTLPSIASIFTSLYPLQHGAGGSLGDFKILRKEAVTVGELFQVAGYRTGAITNVAFLAEEFGMTQGFDTVDAELPRNNVLFRRAGETTDVALKWLENNRKNPFFLFAHYFDPHLTYDPPQPFRRRYADPKDAERNFYVFGSVGDIVNLRKGKLTLKPETISRLEKLYKGEVAYTDSEVGRLLAGLSQYGLDEDTIVIITSDHGEEFGDHGGFEHGHTLYDELVRVPMIVKVPDMVDPSAENGSTGGVGASVRASVRQVDIVPTICELTGVACPSNLVGRSLTDLMKGGEGDRPVLSEGNLWGSSGISWRENGFKLIRQPGETEYQLFDIENDPGEKLDLSKEMPELLEKKRREFDIVLSAISTTHEAGPRPKLSEEELERLRSLGYVE